MTASVYVSYDIKGIQQYIYSIPRLRYVIGGSGLISEFDQRWEHPANTLQGVTVIFSGGGRGVFRCDQPAACDGIRRSLIKLAHEKGLDIRIGTHAEIEYALQRSDELFPYLPDSDKLTGPPCAESGLYPVQSSRSANKNGLVHPLIRKRAKLCKQDPLGELILDRVQRRFPAELLERFTCEFFKNVSPEPEAYFDDETNQRDADYVDDNTLATIGQRALGSRNRWAVIAMDGNSIGRHFKTLREKMPEREAEFLGPISAAIRQTTEYAFDEALVNLVTQWYADVHAIAEERLSYYPVGSTHKRLVLPVRPILLGGDDLVLLCHSSYAIQFIQDFVSFFETHSRDAGQNLAKQIGFNPWEKNGGVLSISAGVLFTKTSLPLHNAIPYAESLLAHAKSRFRPTQSETESDPNTPIPSSIDWEIVTDTMIDSPAQRRQREYRFIDEDIGALIQLTRRPYRLGSIRSKDTHVPSFESLQQSSVEVLRMLPRSVANDLAQAMRLPWAQRAQRLLAMSKNKSHREVVRHLDIDIGPSGSLRTGELWHPTPVSKSDKEASRYLAIETDVLDALSLLEEVRRLRQQTVQS